MVMFHSYVKFPEGTLHYINRPWTWPVLVETKLPNPFNGRVSVNSLDDKLINNIMVYGIQYNEIQLNELLLVQKSYNTNPYVYCGLVVSLGFIRNRG